MARTKAAARKQRSAPRDVVATGDKSSKQKKKLAKSKLKFKAKARREAKVQAINAKKARKEQALREAEEEEDDDEDESGEEEDEGEIDTAEGSEEDEGFICFDTEDSPDRSGGRDNTQSGVTEDGEEEDSASRLMHERMPWMGEKAGYHNKNLYLSLHEEIMDFVRFVSPTREELDRRQELVDEMTEIVSSIWPGATMDTFGSHRTQMFLPNSDIDVVIFGIPQGTKPLFQLAERLEERDLVSYLEVIDKARIPIVKFVHKASNIQVDVSFNVAGGLATADLVRHYMRVYPSFRPLTLVLKYFVAQRGLNETFSGGIGSFFLQLMVVSFLQYHRRSLGPDHDDPKHNNLGQLLVGFFTLFGRDFNYEDLAISVRNGGLFFYKEDRDWYDSGRPFLLSIENPNEPDLDVGKNSYEIRTVKRSFEYARQVLLNEIHRRGQFHPLAGSILGTIIPADSNLLGRVGPETLGYDILYHDPKKTAEIRRQYEARRDEENRKKTAEKAAKRQAQQQRRQNDMNEPPAKRWRGKQSKMF
ncbi:hypothetical protein Poli38472_000885 [Pythium oligandrum]|uniref:polynucleotide adenylyltransferase n=1 Tax=Pythium oligandrum TaxID=41045 RepID=A0A8K1CD72_PYTOL|nr:hypothetical protein Poli38472_000885 [Pythium oligandrum]|eukprot:TMW60843.1 hypothetical protein Poli38472_000885 [Pythium oligandrum]